MYRNIKISFCLKMFEMASIKNWLQKKSIKKIEFDCEMKIHCKISGDVVT